MRSMLKIVSVAALAALAIAAQPSHAALVFTTNFDTIDVPFGTHIFVSSIEGWIGGPQQIEVQNHCCGTPFSEPNLVELDTNGIANSSMSRTITGADNYLLQWHYSPRPGVPANSNGIQVLLDGAPIQTVQLDGTGNLDTVWTLQSVAFNVGTSPATLAFAAIGVAEGVGGYIDSVTLSTVPEPASLALIASGLLGLVLVRRKRA